MSLLTHTKITKIRDKAETGFGCFDAVFVDTITVPATQMRRMVPK